MPAGRIASNWTELRSCWPWRIDSDRDDPARVVSPVYQEVQHHKLLDGPGLCGLLTGQLAQHHFSAAVKLFRDVEQPDRLVVDIDVADRCRAPVESLAATYLVRLDSGALADASPRMIAWNPAGPSRARLELDVEPPSVLALAEARPARDPRAGPRRDPARDFYPPAALPVVLDECTEFDLINGVMALNVQQFQWPGVGRSVAGVGGRGDDVRRPLPNGQCGPFGVGLRLVA